MHTELLTKWAQIWTEYSPAMGETLVECVLCCSKVDQNSATLIHNSVYRTFSAIQTTLTFIQMIHSCFWLLLGSVYDVSLGGRERGSKYPVLRGQFEGIHAWQKSKVSFENEILIQKVKVLVAIFVEQHLLAQVTSPYVPYPSSLPYFPICASRRGAQRGRNGRNSQHHPPSCCRWLTCESLPIIETVS